MRPNPVKPIPERIDREWILRAEALQLGGTAVKGIRKLLQLRPGDDLKLLKYIPSSVLVPRAMPGAPSSFFQFFLFMYPKKWKAS